MDLNIANRNIQYAKCIHFFKKLCRQVKRTDVALARSFSLILIAILIFAFLFRNSRDRLHNYSNGQLKARGQLTARAEMRVSAMLFTIMLLPAAALRKPTISDCKSSPAFRLENALARDRFNLRARFASFSPLCSGIAERKKFDTTL